MALNFENIGTPIAKIIDKNKKELNTVYLADLEIHQKPRHIYGTIELQANETFQQIPDNRERNILYITGASGSGKSYYSADYINQYIKKNPNNEIYLFSSVSDDKVLDKIKKLKRVNINNADFLHTEFDIDDFKNSLLIFDDTDCISNKPLLKKVNEILDKVLQTGRHVGCTAIYTSHTACNGKSTKMILNESHSITFFINGMGGKSMRYLLDQYLGLDKKQIEKVKSIKSRWTTVLKTFPQIVMSQRYMAFTKNL